ncbi:MAG: MltA domain-containing protein [Burkholderiales bacterium]|nr:MltA domain-containing protein [Burkholderiales bacterium]
MMNKKSAKAPPASSTISHMVCLFSFRHSAHARRWAAAILIVGTLSGCGILSSSPWPSAPRSASTAPSGLAMPPVPAGTVLPQPDGLGGLLRPKARWAPAQFSDLPGWGRDRVSAAWPALWQSCQKPLSTWTRICAEVRDLGPQWGPTVGDDFVRQWLESHLEAWRVSSLEGQTSGLLTGYFEPLLEGRRQADARFQYPLYRAPADLGVRKPHYTRAELDNLPEARSAMAGRELVYLDDPLDVLLIQVQGSGRLRLLDEPTPQGQPRTVRLAFGGHNDQPYQSVARWLVDQGAFPLEQASWPAIKNWAAQNPQRVPEMMRANPRMVFFKEEPLPNPDLGPAGAQGVPLIPERSVAVDRDAVPLGTPMWIDSTVPQTWSATPVAPQPLQRLVVAQDTGGAITGAVRADFFWGWGEVALTQAGRTKQPLSVWVLWPR